MSKFFSFSIVSASLILAVLVGNENVQAQQVEAHQASQSTRQLSFFQSEWKTLHLHDAKQAETTVSTLKQLGCEVEQAQHEGHIDLKFRCTTWRSMSLESDDQVKQWLDWMTETGLDTVVRNPQEGLNLPTVSYRLNEVQRAHLADEATAENAKMIFKMLGCQVQTNSHDGHIDLAVDCPEWIVLGVTSEDLAHEWQAWLNSNGFETRHTHLRN